MNGRTVARPRDFLSILDLPDGDLVRLGAEGEAELNGLNPEQVEANENFPKSARLHAKVAALSLACGYTQSTVLQWGAAVAGSPQRCWR